MKYLARMLAILAALAVASPVFAQWEWEEEEGEWVYDMNGYEVDPTGGYEDINGYDDGTGYYDTGIYDDYGYDTGIYDDYDYYDDTGVFEDTDAGLYGNYDYDYDTEDDWWDGW